jgi:hypothetical protein
MDELPPKAAALLRAARREHDPSRSDSERVRVALAASLAPSQLPGDSASGLPRTHDGLFAAGKSASSALSPLVAKVAVALGLLGAGSFGLYSVRSASEASKSPRSLPVAAVKSSVPDQAQVASRAGHVEARGSAGEKDINGNAAASPLPAAPLAEAAAPAEITHPGIVGAGAAASDRRAPPSAGERGRAGSRSSERVRSGTSAPLVISEPVPESSREPVESQSTAHDELALIRRALAMVNAGDAQGALGLLGLHAVRYPNGVMSEERAGLRAIALCRSGDSVQGLAAGQSFLRVFPSSPMAARVRGACKASAK